jgi:FemAB-related protein (PEP-CTERM system-associated)
MSIRVKDLEPPDAARWDAFVHAHQHGSPFHLTAWKDSLAEVFGFPSRSMLALDGDRVAAVLPLFLIDNLLMGRVLLSSPFAVYGGILAESGAARQALLDAAAGMARDLRVQHLELRNAFEDQCSGLPRLDRYVAFTRALEPCDEESLLMAIPRKTRNLVRKAQRFDYSVRDAAGLAAFHDLLARLYRRHGTPLYSRRWFESLRKNLGEHLEVREVCLDGRIVAASLNLVFNGSTHTFFAASDETVWDKSPNNWLYFEHILHAANRGCAVFDFGRSKRDTGNVDFKRHWGTEERPLPYEILLVKRKHMPDFSPKNPRFDLAIRLWRRLPLPLTRLLGPPLVKLFP